MKSLLVSVCCFLSWAAFASSGSPGVFFTDLRMDVTGELAANDMADLTLRLELPFNKEITAAASGSDLWRAKAWISIMKGGGGPKIAYENQILSDEVAATPLDMDPLVLDNIVYTVDLIGVPCSLATYVCVRFQSYSGSPSILFSNGDGTVSSRQTVCEPVECIEDPCTGIYCDIPNCPPGYVVDYEGEGCCPGCIEGTEPTSDPCFGVECGIPICTDGFELSYDVEGCCPACVPSLLKPTLMDCGEYKNGDSWIDRSGGDCLMMSCYEGVLLTAAAMCAMPECDNPVDVPDSCCPVCPEDGEQESTESETKEGMGEGVMKPEEGMEGGVMEPEGGMEEGIMEPEGGVEEGAMEPEGGMEEGIMEPEGEIDPQPEVEPEPNTSEDVCLMPAEVGMCRGFMERWAYNPITEMCELFIYGGCRGNGNNFMSKEDCVSACGLCPDGSEPVECFLYPCLFETCDLYPDAECRPNYCGGCNAEWFVDGEKVNCDEIPPAVIDLCADVECGVLPCPEDVQYTSFGCCPECPQDWGVDPCVLSGNCGMQPTLVAVEENCDGVCTFIYAPVCSTSGETFSNECMFDIAKCKDPTLVIASQGECEEENCDGVCTFIYAPVCSTSGETFSNECMFDIAKCKDPTLVIASQGECEEEDAEEDEESECERQVRVEEEKGLIIGNYIPTCEENGDFTAEQCHGSTGYCWCVGADGQEIEDTRKGPTEERVDCNEAAEEDEESECERQVRVEEEKGLIIGNYIPTCEENGDFTAEQCHGSTGYCWCVGADGQEIEDTRKGPTEERVDCNVMDPQPEGEPEPRIDEADASNCDGYNDGDEWMPRPCESCICIEGSKICAMPDCLPTFCDNPIVEGACCPLCLEETTAPPPDCDGYAEGDTWEPQPCEMCTCVLGRKICASPSCGIPCLNPIPGEGACCPTCPDGPRPECDNYSLGESWITDGGCTDCTCENFGKVCITRECPKTGCFSPKTVEGECCKQCLAPLRVRVNNMHVRARPRIWRGNTPVIADLDVTVRTSKKSENVTGDSLWKMSMWLDSSIKGDGDRLWQMDQILSDEQAAQPLYSSENLYFENISVRVGGPGYECPDSDHFYCLGLMPGDEPSVKFTFSAGGKKSLVRCIKAPCVS